MSLGVGQQRRERARERAGVLNYFIEMNEQLMRDSVPYLKALTV